MLECDQGAAHEFGAFYRRTRAASADAVTATASGGWRGVALERIDSGVDRQRKAACRTSARGI